MGHIAWMLILSLSALSPAKAIAHAFPDSAAPGAGAVLDKAPRAVTIRFDSELEPVFSSLVVKSESGASVSLGNGEVDPGNQTVLTAKLSMIGKGVYHVYWSVIARDGHRTEGDYTFIVR